MRCIPRQSSLTSTAGFEGVNGVISNVYDVSPVFNSSTGELIVSGDCGSSRLAMSTDLLRGETTRYMYNGSGAVSEVTVTDSDDFTNKVSAEAFAYDESKRIVTDSCTYDSANSKSVSSNITYVSDADNRVSNYSFGVNDTIKAQTANQYDAYKRISQKTYTVGGKVFTKGIEYTKTRATEVVDSVGGTTEYGYDEMGRINSINNGNPITYKYDAYGQLDRENNKILDKSFQYVYNGIGNIESVKTYAYTPEGTELSGTPTKTETFTYSADKLTAYNGSFLTYNTNGGVSSYDGWDYTWTRGKLSTIRKILSGTSRALISPVLMPSKTYSYSYNGYGQRVGKSYSYILGASGSTDVYRGMPIGYDKKFHYDQSGRLIAEDSVNRYYNEMDETDHIVYLYDESGIIGMEYTATSGATSTYYYLRNLQGDVIGIYNTNGNRVAEYAYDAWGNCSITLDTNGIASRNPIRYRGYYYDSETGFYYLNARYYNPEWRRFISPDDTAYIDPETPNGLNLYCYCANDPVNYADPSGHSATLLTAILIGLAAAGVATGLAVASATDYYDDGQIFNGSVAWYDYLGASVLGGAIGYGIGYLLAPAILASAGTISSLLSSFGAGNALALAGGGVESIASVRVLEAALATGVLILFAKRAKQSGKATSSDHPSWVNENMIDPNKSPQQNATDILNSKYGPGSWRIGPKSEFNQIVKWIERHLRYYKWR